MGTPHFVVLTTSDLVEGRITVTQSTLTIESNARERLERIHKRIASKLPGVLELRSKEVVSPEQALQTRPAPTVVEPASDEQLEVITMVLRRHYSTFLDLPIPALDDKSPREAARDPRLRSKLDLLLSDHELGVTTRHGPGIIDFAAMRRELDLPD